jgi:hypothetical protein
MKPKSLDLQNLLQGSTPVSVQVVFTQDTGDGIEMCSPSFATYKSVYARLESGEVVPIIDVPVGPGMHHAWIVAGFLSCKYNAPIECEVTQYGE